VAATDLITEAESAADPESVADRSGAADSNAKSVADRSGAADRKSAADAKSVVQSLAKGFRVLEAFESGADEPTLSELAARAGLDAGAAFRLVNTLVTLGYVERVPGAKRYRLTLKVLDLGFAAIGRAELRALARPVLRSLVGEVNEAASLGLLDGTDVVYVERVQAGLTRLGVDIRIGSRIPTYYTAIGHSILAFLPEAGARALLERQERVRLTPTTPTGVDEILALLADVRRRGYALSDQSAVPGLRVLAAPIPDPDGVPYGALSVAAPSVRMPIDAFVARAAEPVIQAAGRLGRAMSLAGASAA